MVNYGATLLCQDQDLNLKQNGQKSQKRKEGFSLKIHFQILPGSIESPNRRHITTVIKMRIDHYWTGCHLFNVGMRDSPCGECGCYEDIFLEYPNNVLSTYLIL